MTGERSLASMFGGNSRTIYQYCPICKGHFAAQHFRDHKLVEEVYDVIKDQNGRVIAKELYKRFGSKHIVRQALTRLTVARRIKRFRSMDERGVVYRYKVIDAQAPRQQV